MPDTINETNNPAEPKQAEPINLPAQLTVEEVEKKAIKWNSEWKTFYDVKKGHWEGNYKLFRQFDKGLVENISTRVYEVWSNIQTEIPHIVNSIFTKSTIVKPIAKYTAPDVRQRELLIQNYVNKMILIVNQGRKDCTDAIQDWFVFGTVIAKTFWDNKLTADFDINATIIDPATGMEVPNPTVQEWVPRYEGKPSFYNVDIFDFALDPNFRGHDLNEALWCRERIYFSKEELKKLMQQGEIIQLSDDKLSPGGTKVETGREIRDRVDGISGMSKFNEKAFVDEFWTELFWEEDGVQKSDKFYFWLLNNDTIIKLKRNTFNRIPYLVSRCYRLAHEFYGLGDVDVMAALSEHINVAHTQGAQLAKETGQKLTLYTSAAGVSSQEIKRRDQGVLKVKDINAIRTENTTAGADLGVLINYKATLRQDLSNAVGINDVLRGENPGDYADSKATTISIFNSNSSARLALKLQNFQDEYIVPLASNFYNLSKQFVDKYSLIIDNKLVQLTQQDFTGDYDFVPQGMIAQSNRNLRIKQLTELAGEIVNGVAASVKSNGAIQMPNFKLGDFYTNEILPLYEISNPEQYFAQPLPPMPPAPTQGAGPTPGVGGSAPIPPTMPVSQSPTTPELEGNAEGNANSVVS